jgi:hypothetical protein
MSREVRRVPSDWQHPKDDRGHFIPLFRGDRYAQHVQDWEECANKWAAGWRPTYCVDEARTMSYAEWAGRRPDPANYMPDWPKRERTHWQMYEIVTEGTPISPVCESPEALARWLADNQANASTGMTASYGQWLAMIRDGAAATFAIGPGRIIGFHTNL